MGKLTGAEAMVRMLEAYGVKQLFGLCGDTTIPFYDALYRLDHCINHTLTRDERHAAYMADGYARISGKVGVCEGPSGGGATYILPGVVEANESSVPLLAITSDVSTKSRGRFPLTELDQKALFDPLTRSSQMLDDASRLPSQVRQAFRAMLSNTPGAAHLGFPFDTQKDEVDESEIFADSNIEGQISRRSVAEDRSIDLAVDRLLQTQKGVIVCGGGVVIAGAEGELQELAERLNLPVATTVSGQGAIAETHPLALGVVGSNGGVAQTRQVVDEADLVFYLGCRAGSVTTERWRSPKTGVSIIHLDSNPAVLGANYPLEVGMLGDAQLSLQTLNRALEATGRQQDHAGRDRVLQAVTEKFAEFSKLADSREQPIRPERVIASLQGVLAAETIICADPGTPCPYFSAYYRWPLSGRRFITNRAHGALGYSLAAAMGAQIAEPDTPVLSVMGDGSFAFCVGELETVVRLNLPIKMLVFSNAVFGWIKAGQHASFKGHYHNVEFSRTDHAAVAAAYGIRPFTVSDPDQLDATLQTAIAHDGPVLVDILSQELHDANAPVSEWVA